MFADPDKVALRRLKRRLKAGASIALALAAGAYLACQRDPPRAAPGSSGSRRTDTGEGAASAGAAGAADAGSDADADAGDGAESGLAVRDGGQPRRLDRREHRSGMPVRDNLLE